MEIEKNETRYRLSADNLIKQKKSAHNWMKRQEIRLNSQSEEIFAERKAIAALMKREDLEFELLKDLITNKFK